MEIIGFGKDCVFWTYVGYNSKFQIRITHHNVAHIVYVHYVDNAIIIVFLFLLHSLLYFIVDLTQAGPQIIADRT